MLYFYYKYFGAINMSFLKINTIKLKLNRNIYNNNNTYNRKTKSRNKKEYDDIIIPAPKRKIQRSILGNKTNNISNSSSSYKNDSDNESSLKNKSFCPYEGNNDNDVNIKKYNLQELKCISEITNLCLDSIKKIPQDENKINIVKEDESFSFASKQNLKISKINHKKGFLNEKKKFANKFKNNRVHKSNLYFKGKLEIDFSEKKENNKFFHKKNKYIHKSNLYFKNLDEESISEKKEEKIYRENNDKHINNKFLPCRKEEQLKIYNYIKNGLKTNGDYNSLYIGGMPGTGKTECVKNVVEYIEIENKRNNGAPFRTLYIDCVNFPKISKLYKSLYNFIFSKKENQKIKSLKYIQILDKFFYERKNFNSNINLNDPSNGHIIIILDEIDFFINRTQYLLYYIFNWTTYPNSKLIIISISNLLNITNQLLPKIVSRFGQNKILFRPYNKEQIRIIIKYKGIDLQKFDEDAIKLSSMKVAAINGDLRRIIVILQKAHELFLNDNKNKIYDNNKLINKFYIIRACNELYDHKMINVLKNFKITEKMVISAILLKNIKDNNNSIKLEDLYDSLQIFVFKFNESNLEVDINWDDFQKIIYNLLRIKIIELDDQTFINFKDNYIHIKFYVDEFMLACQYDEEYKPIYEFLSNLLI